MSLVGPTPRSAKRWRMLTLSVIAVSTLVVAGLLASAASAATNISPSSAKAVKLGVPFTGSWAGTKLVSGRGYTHWWRLPDVMRPGDELQLAIHNQGGADFNVCVVPPVDDFDASDALYGCGPPHIDIGVQTRSVLSYEGSAGQPFLVVQEDDCCGSLTGTYAITAERIISSVNIGMIVPSRIPASFTLMANLTYGDNTPGGDGIPATLQWRFLPASSDNPPPFTDIVTASSTGGIVTFAGTMPTEAQGGTVQLRACVAQPGGDSVRCGASAQTTVAVSACYRALVSRRARTRAFRRTKRKLRRARARNAVRAKRRLKRNLKVKRRKLAKAQRSVGAHC